jgi:hypothetical protein
MKEILADNNGAENSIIHESELNSKIEHYVDKYHNLIGYK